MTFPPVGDISQKERAMTDKSFYYALVAIVIASGFIANAGVLITGVAV
jgi:hypothetical protein